MWIATNSAIKNLQRKNREIQLICCNDIFMLRLETVELMGRKWEGKVIFLCLEAQLKPPLILVIPISGWKWREMHTEWSTKIPHMMHKLSLMAMNRQPHSQVMISENGSGPEKVKIWNLKMIFSSTVSWTMSFILARIKVHLWHSFYIPPLKGRSVIYYPLNYSFPNKQKLNSSQFLHLHCVPFQTNRRKITISISSFFTSYKFSKCRLLSCLGQY